MKWNFWTKAATVVLALIVLATIAHFLGFHVWLVHSDSSDVSAQDQQAGAGGAIGAKAGGGADGVNLGSIGGGWTFVAGGHGAAFCFGGLCGTSLPAKLTAKQTYPLNPALDSTKNSGATDKNGKAIPFEDVGGGAGSGPSTGVEGSASFSSEGSYSGGGGPTKTPSIIVEEMF